MLGWVVEHDLLLGGGGCVIQIRGSGEGVALLACVVFNVFFFLFSTQGISCIS